MTMKNNSPYSAALTGCTFMYYEMNRCLPLLMDADADELLRQEVEQNNLLMVNSLTSRKRFVVEFKRRYNAVPREFWNWYLTLEEPAQRAALLYVMLKTYKLVYDFHNSVTKQKYLSVTKELTPADLNVQFYEIASRDEFVNSWSDLTRKKCIGAYLTILRQVGMLDAKTNILSPIRLKAEDYVYYIRVGDIWFLEACLLQQYEIETVKRALL